MATLADLRSDINEGKWIRGEDWIWGIGLRWSHRDGWLITDDMGVTSAPARMHPNPIHMFRDDWEVVTWPPEGER